jgi:hypothetical protein
MSHYQHTAKFWQNNFILTRQRQRLQGVQEATGTADLVAEREIELQIIQQERRRIKAVLTRQRQRLQRSGRDRHRGVATIRRQTE